MSKIEIDIDTLKRLYISEQKNTHEIAKIFNCSNSTVRARLIESGIELRDLRTKSTNKVILNDNKIRKLYVEKHKSIYAIAKQFNCEKGSVKNRLIKMGVPIRDSGKQRDDLINKDIKRMYIEEKMSTHEIARVLKCDHSTIRKRLNNMGVEIMGNKRTDIDNDELQSVYTSGDFSVMDLAVLYGCSIETIRQRLIKLGVYKAKTHNGNKKIECSTSTTVKKVPDNIKEAARKQFEEIMSRSDIENNYNSKVPCIESKLIPESTQVLINEHKERREKLFEKYAEYCICFAEYTTETAELLSKVLNESANEISRLNSIYESIINQ